MPKTLKNFADSERAREYRNRQRERNYALCPGDDDVRHTRWQHWERRLVMKHDIPLPHDRQERACHTGDGGPRR